MTLDEIKSQKDELYKLVFSFFKDEEKTHFWFNTDNLNFGGVSPNELICCGRGHRVKQFILNALKENQPTDCEKDKNNS